MPRTLRLAMIALLLVLPAGVSLAQQPATPQSHPWTHLRFNDAPETFSFAILADNTGGSRPGVFAEAVRKVNLLQPAFVMSVGDLVENGSEEQWQQFVPLVESLEMPFFFVPGNHDVGWEGRVPEAWRRRFGPTYYHFVYKDVLFLCLNSVDIDPQAKVMITDEQVAWARRVLAENAKVRWTFVFMHVPAFRGETVLERRSNWGPIEQALGDRPFTVFAGHEHRYERLERNGREYIILATTGGVTGEGGPAAGYLDQVVWVTMTADGPRIANLQLEGIFDSGLRTGR